ncbi:type II TA system antitoxin MqsA family protein [Massilia sp. METH4]|uniref:type II TA system antitoxin MqsA family protein n=1 Tax=Massilia sp. METH4 TaxID=3123041 RepID=UPI0030CE52A3
MLENCPGCGADSLVYDKHGVSYTYKDRHTTLPGVTAYHCPQCGDVTLDPAAVHHFDELVARFHRRVDAELAEPAAIAAVRRKLRLDPREADDLFGTESGAFARYEAGEAVPHPSTVKLLKLLERHPELLDELHG